MNLTRLLFILSFFVSNFTFAQWENIDMGGTTWGVGWAMDACDSNCAVISADGLLKTLDAGKTWIDITPPNFTGSIIDVSMISKDNIWIVSVSSPDSSAILYTSDGGNYWTVQFNDPTKTTSFNYIEMFDLQNGVAMGDALSISDAALFLTTENGGETWNKKENNYPILGSADVWRRLDFVSTEIGFFCEYWAGRENQGLTKTIDGGDNWTLLWPNAGFDLIKFYNENIGIMFDRKSIGDLVFGYYIITTRSGGSDSWMYPLDANGMGGDIEFVNDNYNLIWLGVGESLFFSNDFGKTWSESDLNTTVRDIVFVDDNHGWILADNGNLFYTKNNGVITNVEEINTELILNKIVLQQNYPNPFNPVTTINYSIPKNEKRETRKVKLVVYDILGNEIAELANEEKSPGEYQIDFNADNIASGIYYYQLRTDDFVQTRKMMLIK